MQLEGTGKRALLMHYMKSHMQAVMPPGIFTLLKG